MKTRVIKLFTILSLLVVALIPNKVLAISHNLYIINTERMSTLDTSGSYHISNHSGDTYRFNKSYVHEVIDGDSILAYCLNPGKNSPNSASGYIGRRSSGYTDIYNNFNEKLSESQREMLQNILAVSFSDTGNIGAKYGSNDDRNMYQKHSILATQILVWEVVNGGRTSYTPSSLNAPHPNTYDFVQTDTDVARNYSNYLSEAAKLSNAQKPASFGKTHILHWNDGQNKYTNYNNPINIGDYKVDTYDKNLTVSASGSNLTVSSANPITTPQTINFKYVRGSTVGNHSNELQIFVFAEGNNNQKAILSIYHYTSTGNLTVKTESGKFKITKKDSSSKKNLKGSVFKLYKCKTQSNCDTKNAVATIDMKNKEVSSDITINKSGLYLFKETTAPAGYEKVSDFFATLTIADDGKVSAKVESAYQKYVKVNAATNNTVLNIDIYNESRAIQIKKVDGTDTKTQIKGAGFRIYDSKGNVVMFKKVADGSFMYDTAGTIKNIKASSKSIYSVSSLPKGTYTLEEYSVPYPYLLAGDKEERKIKFKIVDGNDYLQVYNYSTNKYVKSSNLTITAKNFKSRVVINKIGNKSKTVEGVVFELYDNKQENKIPLKLNKPGLYEYDPNGEVQELVTNSNGRIKIDYLPAGTYQLKEVRTPENSGLVIDPNNQWTKFTIRIGRDSATPYGFSKEIRNAKGEFCFYKIDEDGNYLDDGKFKLQEYNAKTSKFDDLCLTYNETDKTFSIDSGCKGKVVTFTPVSEKQTCFVDINVKNRYRIVEIEAPKGFVLPSSSDKYAEISINEYGYATGDAVIINKKITTGEDAEASAELIINIQTGQNRIHYIVIIGAILLIAGGLIYYKRKIDKK